MQRIMIISDTHRRHGNLSEAFYNEGHIDMLIHLGDVEGEEALISEMAGCECIFIAGNNDFFSGLDREKELDIAGKKIWLTHGHNYYVSLDLKIIHDEAMARGMDIVMFGHTHRPVIHNEDNITLINPGSISYPRQADNIPTYIMLEIDENNEFSFTLKNV